MMRSGTAAICSAFLYSGFFSNNDEFSRVEVSSSFRHVSIGTMGSFLEALQSSDKLGVRTFIRLLELRLRGKVRHIGRNRS